MSPLNAAAKLPWTSAASVILLSRTTRRVLLLRRGDTAAFMPGAHVFPGGVVNEGETAKEACMRELFEETGVLVTTAGIRTASDEPRLARWQDDVNEKGAKKDLLTQILIEHHVTLSPHSVLHAWSTWLTPNAGHYKRRYMTDFFVLPVDGEPEIRHCTREMSASVWANPVEMMSRSMTGELSVPPPQQYELNRLKDVNVHDIPAHRMRKVIFPQILRAQEEEKANRLYNVLPGDQLYVDEPAGEFNECARELPYDVLANPDKTKPIHRIIYNAKPLYAQPRVIIENIDPLRLREKPNSHKL